MFLKNLRLFATAALIVSLGACLVYQTQERIALEMILHQTQQENIKLKNILTATVEECGDCWLLEPLSESLKRRAK